MAKRIRGGCWLAIFALTLCCGTTAFAAEITDVIDAADEDFLEGKIVPDYFDFHVEPIFQQTIEAGKVTREANCAGGGRCVGEDTVIINKELRYKRTRNELDLQFELSLYKDLELHVTLPIVFSERRSLKYARNAGKACEFATDPLNPKCVNDTNSTVDPSQARVQADVDDGGEFSTYRYFDVPNDGETGFDESLWAEGPERSGLSDITFGIDWAPFNDQRYVYTDDPWVGNHGRATLLLGFDYTAPTADAAAYELADGEWKSNGAVGRGLHELKWRIATSRRFKWVDPYMQFQFGLPISNDTIFKDYGGGQERVAPGPWGNLTLGIEIVPWERLTVDFQQRFAIDLRAHFDYVGEGRDYSPFFDAIGSSSCQGLSYAEVLPDGTRPECGWMAEKWGNAGFNGLAAIDPHGALDQNLALYDDGISSYEGYGRFGGMLGFYIQPVQYVQLKARIGFTHDQEHFMTFAKAGKDVRGRERINPADASAGTRPADVLEDGTVSFDDIRERNPVYNPTYDSIGARFRIEEFTNFAWNVGLAFQF